VTEFREQGQACPVPFIRRGLDGKSAGYAAYWVGKSLQRVAQVMPVARQLGDDQTASKLLEVLKSTLEWWFRAEKYRQDGQPVDDNMFFYDRQWGSLIGVGASHGSDVELNDHHLQHGYWIHAAALVALLDPDWARLDRWGGMVELLIRDIASPSRTDRLFPFLRCFSPYDGHSWASGCGTSEHGPNQESSSEAVNAWAGIILWGQATGNAELTALGVYLYTTETEAIHTYWFDDQADVFDKEYPEPYASIVWASKYSHRTWWTEDPNSIHGINILPVTGGSFHLGRSPQVVLRLHEKVRSEWDGYIRHQSSREPTGNTHPDHWQDLLLSMLALADPPRAHDLWQRSQGRVPDDVAVEFGESRAHTFHWLAALKSLGVPHPDLRADAPLYQAFSRSGRLSYVAYNPDSTERALRFSDGTLIRVPPRSLLRHPLPGRR
jgi:endoglucanase Acf2